MTPLTVERFVGGRVAEAKDVLALAQEHGVRMVDFKFTDLPGTWQHLGLSIHALDEEAFVEGLGFDGSSIRGFQEIAESDMVLLPDPASALIDPFHEQKTLSVLCDVIDPITREPYSRDPRYVAQKAERYLAGTGIADTCYMGPEAEFYVFEHVAFDQTANRSFYEVDSEEGYWNRGRGFGAERNGTPNLGYKLRSQQGYFPTAPGDTHGDLRARMVVALESMGLRCEFQHHEVGSAGQAEINVRFNTLRKMADQIQLQKYVIKNVANQAGKTATFMPKPLFEENGSGMHVHMSLGQRRREPDVRLRRLRPALARGLELHRRDPGPRAGADGVLRADHELVPPAGAGLRGAGEPRVLAAQPLSGVPDPGVLGVAEGEAGGVPARRIRRPTRTWRSLRC